MAAFVMEKAFQAHGAPFLSLPDPAAELPGVPLVDKELRMV
jgi:hypothetical protein